VRSAFEEKRKEKVFSIRYSSGEKRRGHEKRGHLGWGDGLGLIFIPGERNRRLCYPPKGTDDRKKKTS